MSGGGLVELVDREEALRMDEGLVRIARGETAVRLAMGEAFVALGNGWQELGFSSFEGYARERCVRSPRWARDTRALARRLASLPRIRERLMAGKIGWSMAELLARHATAEDEEELLAATDGMTVRQVRRAMRERGEAPEPVEERIGTLELSCTFEEACALVATKPMAELVAGKGVGAWLEGLLGEGQDWLTLVAPHADPAPEDVVARQEAWLASIARGEELADRREARAEGGLPPMPEVAVSPVDSLPSGANAIDRVLFRELAPRLASADVRFGELLARFFAVRGWRVLGFATERQYAEERLGMSRSSVRARISLSRRVTHLSRLGEALREGAVGYEAAALVARVATPDTEEAWIERAKRRTHKHLAEEIHAVEMIAQMMRLEDPPGPPDDEEVAIAQAIERDFVSGAYARRAFAIEREDDEAPSLGEGSSSPFAEMARAARAVQEQLRVAIAAARARSGAVSDADALAACVGVAEPPGALPMRDLEDDLVWMKGAPSAGAPAGARAGEGPRYPLRAGGEELASGEVAAVQMSVSALGEEAAPAARRSGGGALASGAVATVQMSVRALGEEAAPAARRSGGGELASGAAAAVQTSVGALGAQAALGPRRAGGGELAVDGADAVQMSVSAPGEQAAPAPRPAGGGGLATNGEAAVVQTSVSALGVVTAAVCEPGDEEKLAERIRGALAPRWPRVRLRVPAPEWMILHYRQLEAAHGRSGCGGSFVHFLVLGFWAVWAPVLGRSNVCEPITRRDRYVCTCPVCGRPAGPGHHIVLRAHGGGDEMENQTSPCPWCHLEGVHGGRLRVTGEAPGDLVWTIGRTPIMEVRGREKRLAA